MYASNSDKTLVDAIPTTYNDTGYVREWQIGVYYSFPATGYTTTSSGYASTVYSIVDVSSDDKLPTEYTISGLTTAGEENRDGVFDAEYADHMTEVSIVSRTRHINFGFSTSLSA